MDQLGKRDRPYALKKDEGGIYRFGIDFTVKSSEVQHGSSAAFLEDEMKKGRNHPAISMKRKMGCSTSWKGI